MAEQRPMQRQVSLTGLTRRGAEAAGLGEIGAGPAWGGRGGAGLGEVGAGPAWASSGRSWPGAEGAEPAGAGSGKGRPGAEETAAVRLEDGRRPEEAQIGAPTRRDWPRFLANQLDPDQLRERKKEERQRRPERTSAAAWMQVSRSNGQPEQR